MEVDIYPRPAMRVDQAHQLWAILTAWAQFKCVGRIGRKGIITYGEAAIYMGYPPQAGRTLGNPLGIIANYCEQHDLPRLNSIVVDYETGQPGDGIPEDFDGDFESMQAEVINYPWFQIIHPTRRKLRDT